MPEDLDLAFGVTRGPDKVDEWERGQAPLSLTKLDDAAARLLLDLETLAQSGLLGSAMRAKNYIWAMAGDGSILLAVEELAFLEASFPHRGYPRRRGFRHPSEEKKLGHPTLVDGGDVRIAGELAFDQLEEGRVAWVINANSGRYCRRSPPTSEQLEAVAARFEELGIHVVVDYD